MQKMTMTRWTIGLTTLTLLLFGNCRNNPTGQKPSVTENLQDTLTQIKAHSQIPGFAISIVQGDSLIFSQGFGLADIKNNKDYTVETIQPIASISKTFIGLALMKAIEQGHFTLETDINEILPFRITNPFHPTDTIKIKHLATHTSGLLDNDSIFVASYTLKPKPDTDLGTFFKEYFTPSGKLYSSSNFSNYKPGGQFNYSNIAAALVAYLIEIKTKMTFPEFTSKYIFQPLQMTNTHWFYDSAKADRYSVLYEITKHSDPEYKILLNSDNSVKPYTDITYPDGKLFSTIDDMTKYLQTMIKGYSGNDSLISTASFQSLFHRQFDKNTLPVDIEESEPNRAIFWAFDSHDNITHTGSDYGLTTFILFNPKSKVGHVVFFNTAFDGENNEQAINDARHILSTISKFETQWTKQ